MILQLLALVLLLQSQTASIEGVVTKPGSAQPLAGARVSLKPLDKPGQATVLSAFTEDDGKFTFSDVPAGDYTLSMESSRYGSAVYGQRKADGPGTTLILDPGQKLAGLSISMPPTGVIAGRITGRNSEPLVRAMVQAFRYSYRNGEKVLTPVKSTTADDLGEYRLYGLQAGKYFVAATIHESQGGVLMGPTMIHQDGAAARRALPAELLLMDSFLAGRALNRVLDDGTVREEAWVPVYYPGTIDVQQATVVEVVPGVTMSGVNLAAFPSPVRKVSGQVIGTPGGSPAVTLTPHSTYLGFKDTTPNAGGRPGSTFEFNGLSPGAYTLIARDPKTQSSSDPLRIELGDRDIENITLSLVPGVTLQGRVVVEGSPQALTGMQVFLSQGDLEHSGNFAALRETGDFVMANMAPGTYFARLIFPMDFVPQTGLYADSGVSNSPIVKSIRLGQADVSNGIPVGAATRERLEIVVSSESGSVEGTVTDLRRSPLPGATVVLVPSVARRNSALYRSSIADGAGRFRLSGVAPGDYLLFAWDDVETGAWQDPEFLRPQETRGRSVRVQPGRNQVDSILSISNP